jgi:P-type Ca2+ transporter type 2C
MLLHLLIPVFFGPCRFILVCYSKVLSDHFIFCPLFEFQVRMVTGDNLQTARAIALECGILTDTNVLEPFIIEGKAFRALSDSEREKVAGKISVCFLLA